MEQTDFMNHWLEALMILLVQGLAGSLVFLVPLWGPQLVLRRERASTCDTLTNSSPVSARVATIGVADGLVLMSFMACANSVVGYLRDEIPFLAFVIQGICINLLVFLIWYQCQKLMRHYGVLHPRARVLIQVVMYPLTLIAIGQLLVALITLIATVTGYTRGRSSAELYQQTVISAGALAISMLVIVGLRVVFARLYIEGDATAHSGDTDQALE